MKTGCMSALAGLLLAGMPNPAAIAQVVFQTADRRLEIQEDGMLGSLRSRPGGVEYASACNSRPVAAVYRGGRAVPTSSGKYAYTGRWVYRGGKSFPASRVTLRGDRLTIGFAGAGVTATYRVTAPTRSTRDPQPSPPRAMQNPSLLLSPILVVPGATHERQPPHDRSSNRQPRACPRTVCPSNTPICFCSSMSHRWTVLSEPLGKARIFPFGLNATENTLNTPPRDAVASLCPLTSQR